MSITEEEEKEKKFILSYLKINLEFNFEINLILNLF